MKKVLLVLLAAAAFAGCHTIELTKAQRADIKAMQAKGITWAKERDAGRYKPAVNMTAAVWWSLLPGAGQIFMAHHMDKSSNPALHGIGAGKLRAEAVPMLGLSWIPVVYVFTMPCGMLSGVMVDVNRINNIDLLTKGAKAK